MNLNHIQTVAKYESKIFAKLALLDYGRFVACRDIGRFTDLFFHLWIFGTDGIGLACPVAWKLSVIVKTCSDSLFSIGQKNCQLFVAKLRNFLDSHNRMVLY